ncbi:MAG TPA: thiol-disulfide isomerase [Bryobacteraceae bacterium]|nr:thiol-disulfide isomerase [Bryobacteraceae bacterium]
MAATVAMAANTSAPRNVTYTKDVASILDKSCVECHRPTMFAPMSLMTYDEVRPWARAIKEKVVMRQMPPWHADDPAGVFKNDPRLLQTEIDTIAAWVDAGAPKGADKDMPPTPTFSTDGWTIGKPDVVFSMATEYPIPAEGTVPYLNFRIPTHLGEDKWIQAYEFRPSNRAQVHHVVATIVPPNAGPGAIAEGMGSLGNLVPSRPGVLLPPGVAKLLPANSDIILQMHYTTNGTPSTDRTEVGLIFAKEPPKQLVGSAGVTNLTFVIPPNDPNYEVRTKRKLTKDTLVWAFMPHMHVRGKDMTILAHFGDGRTQTLLSVPRYDFRWQTTYELKQAELLPKGTEIEVIAHYDNSARNLNNPDPSHEVRWGDQTWEEMMIAAIETLGDRDTPQPQKTTSSGGGQ